MLIPAFYIVTAPTENTVGWTKVRRKGGNTAKVVQQRGKNQTNALLHCISESLCKDKLPLSRGKIG